MNIWQIYCNCELGINFGQKRQAMYPEERDPRIIKKRPWLICLNCRFDSTGPIKNTGVDYFRPFKVKVRGTDCTADQFFSIKSEKWVFSADQRNKVIPDWLKDSKNSISWAKRPQFSQFLQKKLSTSKTQ